MQIYNLLFLLCIIITIYGSSKGISPYYLIVFFVTCISLLSINYNNDKTYNKSSKVKSEPILNRTNDCLYDDQDNIDDDELKQIKMKIKEAFKVTDVVEIYKKPVTYSEENYKKNIFSELSSSGDTLLATQMKHMSNKNREAIDNFSRMRTKYSNLHYFENELNDTANTRWWDDDDLESEF